MPHTKWKQDFFAAVPPIALVDPLASVLGAIDDGAPIYYSFQECVKLAGHACASVASAFKMTHLALAALYGDAPPVRGEIAVRFAGDREIGANGPIGQVIQFLTGAAIETGFHGLGGNFARANLFVYDPTMTGRGAITVLYRRIDTCAEVTVHANPSAIPMTEQDKVNAQLMPKIIQGAATPEEREAFYAYWQGRNRRILLEEHPGAFVVERRG
ncbi:MAG: hypothetical protein HQK87_04650 [Nitrospinae bacterium]|nr:hypothetical protein [Nitrospinota bacterium]